MKKKKTNPVTSVPVLEVQRLLSQVDIARVKTQNVMIELGLLAHAKDVHPRILKLAMLGLRAECDVVRAELHRVRDHFEMTVSPDAALRERAKLPMSCADSEFLRARAGNRATSHFRVTEAMDIPF